MKVTVCELHDDSSGLEHDWSGLVKHVQDEKSDLVLLPEMPFSPWLATTKAVDFSAWRMAVENHDRWINRLAELSPAVVCGSRPVILNGRPHNEGFVWEADSGYRGVHLKVFLPNEPGFWEATWYDRGPYEFIPTQTRVGKIGFLICTEIWFTEYARAYARQGVQILVCPRATESTTTAKWIMGGRVAAVMSGAYCLSSNRAGFDSAGMEWGKSGWVAEPDQGNLLGTTSPSSPFLTAEIDLAAADRAKQTYPRYVSE